MAEIKLYKTTAKGLKIVGMSIPFVVVGIAMIEQEPVGSAHYIVGWVSTFLFGAGIPLGLFQAFDKRPQIIITKTGIWDRATRQPQVKWEQITQAYPMDFSGQKFISIETDDTYNLKKAKYKWVSRLSRHIGVQDLNLQLSQINIDINELCELINQLSNTEKDDRRFLIEPFKISMKRSTLSGFYKIPIYALILAGLVYLSINYDSMLAISAIIILPLAFFLKWFQYNNKYLQLKRFAETMVWVWFIHLVVSYMIMLSFDLIAEDIGLRMTIAIKEYKKEHETYPDDITLIQDGLSLNFAEQYVANRIDYRQLGVNYLLILNGLFDRTKRYDPAFETWK